jgi:hypothetical protein
MLFDYLARGSASDPAREEEPEQEPADADGA